MKKHCLKLLLVSLTALSACSDLYEPTLYPDYAIRVIPSKQGSIAVPPECPSWETALANPFDNQPMPQFGCSDAKNLAAMIENPNDLVEGRKLDNARGVLAVGSVRRYDNNQTRGLILSGAETNQAAATTAATGASALTGDVTAGGSSSASTSATSSESQ